VKDSLESCVTPWWPWRIYQDSLDRTLAPANLTEESAQKIVLLTGLPQT
jgi:hypothetical protein